MLQKATVPLNLLPPTPVDETPTQTNADVPPEKCFYCAESFPARRVGVKWAEVCLDCKRIKHHHMDGFPVNYAKITMADVIERDGNRQALQEIREWAAFEGDRNLWFYGSPGTGKTYLACLAAYNGPIGQAKFYRVPELILKLQASVKAHDELDVISSIVGDTKSQNRGMVRVFDDLGAHRISDFAIEMFGLLLDKFYSNGYKGLIFTTNLSPKEINSTMGERVSSRLMGLAKPIRVDGPDLRLQS